jgi:hypothetical protein
MRFIAHPHRLLITTAAAAALLAGCSDDTGETDPAPLDTQEQVTTTVASTDPGASGGGGDRTSTETPDAPNGGAGVGSNDEWRSETDGRDLDD